MEDIEAELSSYPVSVFKDKVIYCPMDVAVNTGTTMQSQFVKYFQMNAHRLQFKKLICTCLVEHAAAEGESPEQVQNCYVLERVTAPVQQRNIYGYTHGCGQSNAVIGERDFATETGAGVVMYDTQDGMSHKVPWHIVNQAVTAPEGRYTLVKKYVDHYDETDGHPVFGDVDTGKTWEWNGHRLSIKWHKRPPVGEDEPLGDECYFFNNGDFLSDFSIFPKDVNGEPCFESVDGGSVCLYPAEYYDYRESEYELYSTHCPTDGEYKSGDFRSKYCAFLIVQSDIVVTNPPFSVFREFMSWLKQYRKDFIIIGNMNCVAYKDIFPLVRNRDMLVGFNTVGGTRKGNSMYFYSPADGCLKDIQSWWFTSLDNVKIAGKHDRSDYLKMCDLEARGVVYHRYSDYPAINVPAESKIPGDYRDVMGVPITALRYLDLDLFDIVTYRRRLDGTSFLCTRDIELMFNRLAERVWNYFMECASEDREYNYMMYDAFEQSVELSVSEKSFAMDIFNNLELYHRWICSGWAKLQSVSAEVIDKIFGTVTDRDFSVDGYYPDDSELVDIFYPIVVSGCVEPCIDVVEIRKCGESEVKSRQIMYEGRLCQKTYHRMLIRRRDL